MRQNRHKESRSVYGELVFIELQFPLTHECLSALFNERAVVERGLSSSHQRVNVSPGQKQGGLLLSITSSNGGDEDLIQRRAYGF